MRLSFWIRATAPVLGEWRRVTLEEFRAEWDWAEFVANIEPDFPVPVQFAVWEG